MLGTVMMRGLTPDEMALIPPSFAAHIEMDRLRLIGRTHNPFTRGKIVARGYDLYWRGYPKDFTQQPLYIRALLMHELCHVWQYATGRLTAWRYITRPKNWIYGYRFDPAKAFDDYAIEKQADILQDWYHMNHGAPAFRHHTDSPPPSLAQINALVPFAWDLSQDDSPPLRTIGDDDTLIV